MPNPLGVAEEIPHPDDGRGVRGEGSVLAECLVTRQHFARAIPLPRPSWDVSGKGARGYRLALQASTPAIGNFSPRNSGAP